MKKHFVEFLSPGTFVSESTQQDIDSWNVEQAKIMARDIKERHGATPYGFRFITRERKDNEFDSKVVQTSGIYFLGGRIKTIEELILINDPKDEILIWNMKNNGYDRVIENMNSYKSTLPLTKDDVVLEWN